MFENLKKNYYFYIFLVFIIYKFMSKIDFTIENKNIRNKYDSLVKILDKPTYVEMSHDKLMKTATWMEPLDNYKTKGKFGGCDYIKIHGYPAKKWHPHPADVFLIVGKYMKVPEHLFGPLKHASETINIEQLFVPDEYANKYFETGKKELALVTGSCASVTISVITIQFVIDMIKKYKDNTYQSIELYDEFRKEYDRRINDYLCGPGITNKIDWYDHKYFEETDKYYIGDEKCKN